MVDGGGGNTVLHQLKAAGLNWMDMRDIFVTHKHIDHLLGIIWMVRMICQFMRRGEYEGEARIYAHDEVIALIRDMADKLLLSKDTRFIDDRLHLIELRDGDYGFTMDIGDGEKMTCCGDEPFSERERTYVEGSKWLLHEAFCLYSERDFFKPYEKHHSTVKEACILAEQMQIRNLLLYHTEEKNLADRKRLYTSEGKKYFHGNLFIPDDLETVVLQPEVKN